MNSFFAILLIILLRIWLISSFHSTNKLQSRFITFKTLNRSQLPPLSSTPNNSGNLIEIIKDNTKSRPNQAILLLKVWLLFTFYAFKLAPPDLDPDSTAFLIQKCFNNPYDGLVNPIFVTIFNLLGVYPAIFASLLLPGTKKQNIPGAPFIFSSFALGFFGLGPYLALRKPSVEGTKSNAGFGSGLFESKVVPIILILSTIFLLFSGVTTTMVDGSNKIENFISLFQSKPIVHVSTIDFVILTLVVRAYYLSLS